MRRAADQEVDLRASLFKLVTRILLVVPRTIESSMMITRFPPDEIRNQVELHPDGEFPDELGRLGKLRPT